MTDGYDNSMTGASFKNDYKKAEKHPDFKGKLEVTCPHCEKSISLEQATWKKTSAKGLTYLFHTLQVEGQWKPAETETPKTETPVEDEW